MDVPRLLLAPPTMRQAELVHSDVTQGGVWRPIRCQARQKVAIIVPFRDREQHLPIFLQHMHTMLHRQQLEYRILVIEQVIGYYGCVLIPGL